jgi:outer membrane protein assembly factor BamB
VSQAWPQDWPQWRGPDRDGIAQGFKAPATWPEELVKKWSVSVGDGVATPALVSDKLFVFAREDGNEVIRCLDTAAGKEVWQDKYAAEAVGGPASGFAGPRSSPAVADGKVVTLGVHGMVSCIEAATGKVLWRKNDFEGSEPRFATASSPMILGDVCIVLVGGDRGGAIVAYDLATGNEKWKWAGDGAAYASPVLMTVDGTKAILTPTAQNLVIVSVADGKLLWQGGYAQGRYNATTPIVIGQTVIYAGEGRGTTAEKFLTKADKLTSDYVWQNPDNSLMFNSPVLKDGVFYGISSLNNVFCVDVESGKTAWSASLASADRQPAGGGRRPGGRGGYGSIVDAGSVLFALTPAGELVVFEPNAKEFKRLAGYKVAEGGSYAYPVIAGNRVFIKDRNSVTLWAIE